MEQGCNVFNSYNILSHNPNILWDLGHFMSISSACFYSLCLPFLDCLYHFNKILVIDLVCARGCSHSRACELGWVRTAYAYHPLLIDTISTRLACRIYHTIILFHEFGVCVHACMHTHVVLMHAYTCIFDPLIGFARLHFWSPNWFRQNGYASMGPASWCPCDHCTTSRARSPRLLPRLI